MATTIVKADAAALSREGRVSESARHYARKSRADNTVLGYKRDFTRFARWCREGRANSSEPISVDSPAGP